MHTTAKISVIIPLYNKQATVLSTIESVLNQTHEAYEVIVVNDGSTDAGASILLDKMQSDIRFAGVRYFEQDNSGVSAARNRGIDAAHGTHLAFLDADDTWEPHFLETMVELIGKFPQAVAYASAYQKQLGESSFVDPKIRFRRKPKLYDILPCYFEVSAAGDLPFMISSMCVPVASFARVGGFPEGEPMGEDQDFFSRLAMAGDIAYCPRVLLFYRLDAENRACESCVPIQECPFSRRLHALIENGAIAVGQRYKVTQYMATHLIDLARRNTARGRFYAAYQLLSDNRCESLPAKKWRALIMLVLAVLRRRIKVETTA